jgi:hypothetical protein
MMSAEAVRPGGDAAAWLDLPPVENQMPDIDLPAPQGELRWANFSSVGGGSLCVFWAAGEQLVRHDCIVPTRSC